MSTDSASQTAAPHAAPAPAGPELACLDGVIAPSSETKIDVTDEGFLRGDGVFELVRVYPQGPFALGEHLDRMELSLAGAHLGFELPRAELEREVAQLLEQRGAAFVGALRLVVTIRGRRLVMTEQLPSAPERIRLGFVTYAPTRVLDGVKTLSYGANMLAGRLARERGFDEALLVTPHGRVLEAPTSSIFWVGPDGALCTPPLDEHILASITRDALLSLLEVDERACTKDDILAAEEAFIVSTTREVHSVAAIEEREFAEAGPRTTSAAAALREHIEAELAGA